MRFLVVDDSVTIRRIVINTLKSIGYPDIVEAEDGADAQAKLESEKVDFVITDWNMPNASGLDLAVFIRGHATYNSLPILMITTRGSKEDILEALRVKVNNYIVKPFTPELLKEKIDAVLKAV